jgi:Flp pilus assembly CpaF family ATPase
VGERCQRPAASLYQHHRPRIVARGHRGFRLDVRAIKTNICDSLNVVIHVERRPGRRFISEVLEINGYHPDADLFDCRIVFQKEESKP